MGLRSSGRLAPCECSATRLSENFSGFGGFLYIDDKESVLRWVISIAATPLRPTVALLRARPKTPLSLSYNRSEFSDSLRQIQSSSRLPLIALSGSEACAAADECGCGCSGQQH